MGGDSRNSESRTKRRSYSSDSPAEKRVYQERIPLEDLAEEPRLLASTVVNVLSWDLVVGMLPNYLKTRSKKEVIKMVGDELEGMSKRRIDAILNGEDISTSSSLESESEYSYSNGEDDDNVHSTYSENNESRGRNYDDESSTSGNHRSELTRSSSGSLIDDEEIVIND